MPSIRKLLPYVLVLFCALRLAHAQDHSVNRSYRLEQHKTHPIFAGVYAAAGFSALSTQNTRLAGLQGQAGGYAEYARFAFRPGMDARVYGNATGLGCVEGCGGGPGSAKLAGPRLSFVKGLVHPYIEGLFGTGVQDDVVYTSTGTQSISGTAKLFVAGFDLIAEQHIEVRLLEYSIGHLGPAMGARLQSFTTGIVLRFP